MLLRHTVIHTAVRTSSVVQIPLHTLQGPVVQTIRHFTRCKDPLSKYHHTRCKDLICSPIPTRYPKTLPVLQQPHPLSKPSDPTNNPRAATTPSVVQRHFPRCKDLIRCPNHQTLHALQRPHPLSKPSDALGIIPTNNSLSLSSIPYHRLYHYLLNFLCVL